MAIVGVLPFAWIFSMVPGGGAGQAGNRGFGGSRRPPAWSPKREAIHPSRHWVQDLLAWSILATDMDSSQQRAAIILQLGDVARELTR